MIARGTVGNAMLGIGVAGVVASLVGMVVGWQLVGQLDTALGRSLGLTADALASIDLSLAAAEDLVAIIGDGIGDAEATARTLATTTAEGEALLGSVATLTRDDVAGSLAAVESSLPALVDVARTIDRTLSALDALPIGVSYDPEQPFDASVRDIQASLDGLPEKLRGQADLVDAAGANLGRVGADAALVAGDLRRADAAVARAQRLLGDYAGDAAQARSLVADAQADLAGQARSARVLVVLLGLVIAAGQVVPLWVGWELRTAPLPESVR